MPSLQQTSAQSFPHPPFRRWAIIFTLHSKQPRGPRELQTSSSPACRILDGCSWITPPVSTSTSASPTIPDPTPTSCMKNGSSSRRQQQAARIKLSPQMPAWYSLAYKIPQTKEALSTALSPVAQTKRQWVKLPCFVTSILWDGQANIPRKQQWPPCTAQCLLQKMSE